MFDIIKIDISFPVEFKKKIERMKETVLNNFPTSDF